MTDNCSAMKGALAATWPAARQFLCVFHVLQQVWRWLLDSKHAIKKEDRQEMMATVKSLVYASSKGDFFKAWQEFKANPLSQRYTNFSSYLQSLMDRREEWAIAFREGAMLRGHHTNNFCEATMCIIKEVVLNRCKAYNPVQLIVFMAEIFNGYMKKRLVDVALGRRKVKNISMGTLSLDAVTPLGGGKFQVASQSKASVQYKVDMQTGFCECVVGQTGSLCKHQAACAEHSMVVLPQVFTATSENRRWLASVAVGEEKTPPASFFEGLLETPKKVHKENYSTSAAAECMYDQPLLENDSISTAAELSAMHDQPMLDRKVKSSNNRSGELNEFMATLQTLNDKYGDENTGSASKQP
ncbi:uncharacterized protein LOC126987091 [Eriocheir sinensis]|uniref:uncharacterized protein LOC126987091 n=1 Tax=Eriocheir sinensis TaxID=95602 RepID=UPI0021C8B631|nr:uncharacterized protein LOC126987091 [Eriocheir sinensis]